MQKIFITGSFAMPVPQSRYPFFFNRIQNEGFVHRDPVTDFGPFSPQTVSYFDKNPAISEIAPVFLLKCPARPARTT